MGGHNVFQAHPATARDGELIKQPNCTECLHVDTTLIRSFRKELFSLFLPAAYAGHVGLAAAKP